ncbi:Acyl-[acyl-carrier-protein]--UDP-N-acetylglucosamine O-acyltransferase [hydrothermal vent metagenome]|uniref:Acyl-[acyl-carrier-protein]--UDP-N-acetylglucosamine O-acyltransferase n=1 Tax=hydrothermal vent metagenome TaxID=652676 RepID=A0A3B0YGJ2_9ZZZZ
MIHERAIVNPAAVLAHDVEVGPFSVIEEGVEIGEGTVIGPHVVISGPTKIGKRNKIFQFSSIGAAPQDKKYDNEPTELIIGDDNTIRENVTLNRGTTQGGGVTKIGSRNWIMAYVHLAHDCIVGNDTVLANGTTLAGHVTIDDFAILGGFTLIHQFCQIGAYSFTAFSTGIKQDVPPYVMVSGHAGSPHGLNIEGLRRHGFDKDQIRNIKKCYKLLYKSGMKLDVAKQEIKAIAKDCPEIKILTEFLDKSTRSIVR